MTRLLNVWLGLRKEYYYVSLCRRQRIFKKNESFMFLDYNLCILSCRGFDINDGRNIKEYIRKCFNVILNLNEWSDCSDSTYALTTEQRHFTKENNASFSIDLCIVVESGNAWWRLIHNKTGFWEQDEWYWNEGKSSNGLIDRVKWLKANNF